MKTITAEPYSALDKDALYEILRLRSEVFLLEQHIVCQDLDGIDREACHVCLCEDGDIVGYLRIYKDGDCVRIGRVLITKEQRGKHNGVFLMDGGIRIAGEHFPGLPVKIHAQEQALGFYEKCGFKICSARFMEEGIPHFEMEYTRIA